MSGPQKAADLARAPLFRTPSDDRREGVIVVLGLSTCDFACFLRKAFVLR